MAISVGWVNHCTPKTGKNLKLPILPVKLEKRNPALKDGIGSSKMYSKYFLIVSSFSFVFSSIVPISSVVSDGSFLLDNWLYLYFET